MADVGDRVSVASNKAGAPPRLGSVKAKTGNLLRVEWDSGEESTFMPGPGSVEVLRGSRARRPAAAKAAGKKAPPAGRGAGKATNPVQKAPGPAKSSAAKAAPGTRTGKAAGVGKAAASGGQTAAGGSEGARKAAGAAKKTAGVKKPAAKGR